MAVKTLVPFEIAGSLTTATTAITGATTLTDAHSVVLASATGGAFSVTVPTAVGCAGRRYTIKRTNSGANAVTVAAATLIDGDASVILSAQYATIVIVSDGATWQLENYLPGLWTAYTPTWTASSSPPSIGNGSLTARFLKVGRLCHLELLVSFGSTTNGGVGFYTFSLPFTASSGVDHLGVCKAFVTGSTNYQGFSFVGSGGTTVLPYMPASATDGSMQPAGGTSNGSPGTGIPLIAGQYTFTSGTNLLISISYATA